MHLDQVLVDAAVAQLDRRWPAPAEGAAAAVYLDDGAIVTSVGLDNINAGVNLCAETGAFCQAYTLGRRITASVCVYRMPEPERVVVLAPCGICQERLALWGPDVEVGVPDPGQPAGWRARTLAEAHPYYWAREFAGGAWPSELLHRT